MTKIELGDLVKDTVTGFVGVAIGKTTWLYGCNRIAVQPKIGKDGKIPDTSSFDEPQLIVVKKRATPRDERKVKTGGFNIRITQKETPRR